VGIWWKYIKPSKMKMWIHEAGKQGTTASKMKMWVYGAGRLRPGEKRKPKSPKVFSNVEKMVTPFRRPQLLIPWAFL
jgi:hypothetical protein